MEPLVEAKSSYEPFLVVSETPDPVSRQANFASLSERVGDLGVPSPPLGQEPRGIALLLPTRNGNARRHATDFGKLLRLSLLFDEAAQDAVRDLGILGEFDTPFAGYGPLIVDQAKGDRLVVLPVGGLALAGLLELYGHLDIGTVLFCLRCDDRRIELPRPCTRSVVPALVVSGVVYPKNANSALREALIPRNDLFPRLLILQVAGGEAHHVVEDEKVDPAKVSDQGVHPSLPSRSIQGRHFLGVFFAENREIRVRPCLW